MRAVTITMLDRDGAGAAVVTGAVYRMVTSPDRPAYVEPLVQTRIVLSGADGLWRIDVATTGD